MRRCAAAGWAREREPIRHNGTTAGTDKEDRRFLPPQRSTSGSTVIRRPQLQSDPALPSGPKRSESWRLIQKATTDQTSSPANLSAAGPAVGSKPTSPSENITRSSSESCSSPTLAEDLQAAVEAAVREIVNTHERAMQKIAKQMGSIQEFYAYADLLKYNYLIRDLFLSHLAEMFADFETFVIPGDAEPVSSTYSHSDDSEYSGLQAFDKVGFLSDCPETHIPFLSAFLETQMFASFLDARLSTLGCVLCGQRKTTEVEVEGQSLREEGATATSPLLAAFLARVSRCKSQKTQTPEPSAGRSGSLHRKISVPDFQPTVAVDGAMSSVNLRRIRTFAGAMSSHLESVGFCHAPKPHVLFGGQHRSEVLKISQQASTSRFPTLDTGQLGRSPANRNASLGAPQGTAVPSHFLLHTAVASAPTGLSPGGSSAGISANTSFPRRCQHCSAVSATTTGNSPKPGSRSAQVKGREGLTRLFGASAPFSDLQSPVMAQAHWDFVDALLEECRHRTKRMVIQKMGQEAANLGHNYHSLSEVEENTLVSGLCDLLERIWSHGLQTKHGASALWTHLTLYLERNLPMESAPAGDFSPPPPSSLYARSSLPFDNRLVGSPSCNLRDGNSNSLSPLTTRSSVQSPRLDDFTPAASPHPVRTSGRLPPTDMGGYGSLPRSRESRWTERQAGGQPVGRSLSLTPGQRVQRSPAATRMRSFLPSWVSSRSTVISATPVVTEIANGTGSAGTGNPASSLLVVDVSGLRDDALSDVDIFGRDVLAIRSTVDAKSQIGLARAFVRLALEKKRLSIYLKLLLSDAHLLRELYARHAFLRCEEEREQFIVHLLSLNAVDYYSFTRMLPKAELVYRISVVTGRKQIGRCSAGVWISLRGHLGSSGTIDLERSGTYVEFKHRNLGILNTLRIGHDNAGLTPKMFVEAVLVSTPLTGHVYTFQCNHWLGRGVEDSSCERLLIGQIAHVSKKGTVTLPRSGDDPTESLSASNLSIPTLKIYGHDSVNPVAEALIDGLANSINRLAKHFANSGVEGEMSLSALLCGDGGLVPALNAVFTYGFRSGRLFQRKLYAWDFFTRFVQHYTNDQTGQIQCGDMYIGGFNVSFSHPPLPQPPLQLSTNQQQHQQQRHHSIDQSKSYESRTLPRPSATMGTGPHNVDSRSSGTSRRLQEFRPILLGRSSSPATSHFYGGAVRGRPPLSLSQPCSPANRRIWNPVRTIPAPAADFARDLPLSLSSMVSPIPGRPYALVLENFIATFNLVNRSGANVGKLGKFQRLMCIGCRDHTLSTWFPVLATGPVAAQLYDNQSFLLNCDLRNSLQTLLLSLNDFDFRLDPVILGN
ncbi:DENN domain-containing protein 5B [Sparganum proliferum]